jgi:hypothetical protein
VRGLLVIGLAALALAGCSAAPDTPPPPVKLDDLNLTPYLDKACSLFDADQLADLRIARAAVNDVVTKADCVLTPSDPAKPPIMFSLKTGTQPPTGMATKVAGYPAVEQRTAGHCTVWVVVAPTQQIMADARGEEGCHSAETVATTAIATIKRLNP